MSAVYRDNGVEHERAMTLLLPSHLGNPLAIAVFWRVTGAW
jgi:hypothetical protein